MVRASGICYANRFSRATKFIEKGGETNEDQNHVVTRLGSALLLVSSLLLASHEASALNRNVRIHNNSSYVMTELRASHIDKNGWEEDMLGTRKLAPGRIISANIDDGSGYCRYDLKAVFSSGAEVVRWNVNVCAVSDWYIFNHTDTFE
jgi:hypothetical protein